MRYVNGTISNLYFVGDAPGLSNSLKTCFTARAKQCGVWLITNASIIGLGLTMAKLGGLI